MSLFNCNCECSCTVAAVIASAIVGVVTAFLQIAGVISVAPVFLCVVFGIAVAYLGVLVVATALARRSGQCICKCDTLHALLIGILGTILFAMVLLAVGIVATSVVSAILVGLVLFFFSLTLQAPLASSDASLIAVTKTETKGVAANFCFAATPQYGGDYGTRFTFLPPGAKIIIVTSF